MKWVRLLIYSNFFVACLLALLAVSTYVEVSGLAWKWYVPLNLFLGSFVLYTFHRLYKIDFIPESQLGFRHHWILAHANTMKYSMSLAVFCMMLLLPNFNADTIVWLVPAGLISIGYTIPVVPSDKGWRRFRDIPFSKPLIISIVVGYLTYAFPVFEQRGISAIFEAEVFRGLSERILFLLAVTIPFDLRDVVNDRDAGLETIATEWGFHRAKWVCYIVVSSWLGFELSGMLVEEWTYIHAVKTLSLFGLVVFAVYRMSESWSDIRYTLVFEGLIVLYSLSTFL